MGDSYPRIYLARTLLRECGEVRRRQKDRDGYLPRPRSVKPPRPHLLKLSLHIRHSHHSRRHHRLFRRLRYSRRRPRYL